MTADIQWFKDARYGMIIHYGLYSLLGRGEWVLNRERIPVDEYRSLADEFTAENLDFDDLCGRARNDWGMGYAILTCKHHDGFCLYDSQLTDFTSVKTRCGRDLVGEFVEACRKHGLRIALYHSLNDWTHQPNAVDALERPAEAYGPFIDFVHGQIREIMTRYGKIDVMWYDGWWPYDAKGWQAEKLNAMVRSLQPGILINGRCGLPGDFGTPEGHVSADPHGRPWEACMTLNDNWGFHKGDRNWKRPAEVVELLRQCACGQGNLVINVGPAGDGSLPHAAAACLDRAGQWLKRHRAAIFNTDRFMMGMYERGDARADWTHSGKFSAAGNCLYWHIRHWPGNPLVLGGMESTVVEVSELASGRLHAFRQEGDRVILDDVPADMDTEMPVVFCLRTETPPVLYNCGGIRVPNAPHCRYDPLPSDIQVVP